MTIGFLGAGKMAEAILAAAINSGMCDPWEIVACDKSAERRAWLEEQYEVAVSDDPAQTVKNCKTLLLAVKPQDLAALLTSIGGRLNTRHLVISIAAGKKLSVLRKLCGEKPRICRVMPNLPLMAGEGMSVYCAPKETRPADKKVVEQLFGVAGAVLELPERNFDAVTALSGSGPAFVAYLLQALTEAAVKLRLPRATARLLAEQTLIGTGIYLQNRGQDCAGFIQEVCSPQGTTEAGMRVLQASDVADTLAATLAAAAARSRELSR